jgi:ribosomal protein L37AE/L43A
MEHHDSSQIQQRIKKEESKVEIKKKDVEKCPHCYKKFAVEELPVHIEQEHFM